MNGRQAPPARRSPTAPVRLRRKRAFSRTAALTERAVTKRFGPVGGVGKGNIMQTGWKCERSWRLAGCAVIGLLGACVAPEGMEQATSLGAQEESLVDIEHSQVQRQSIGNCWIYSHASWIESMYLTDQGTELPLSQSYWTYWHWFDQITGSLSRREGEVEISTGGTFSVANGIVRRYGLMTESAFVPEDVEPEISWRQFDALQRINESLATGVLSTLEARADRALVRAELDAAWELGE